MIQRSKSKNGDQIKVTFALPQDHAHSPQAVVGDFNQWDPTVNPMKRRSNNTYSATITLATGQRYAFRYLCEGNQWCNDDDADGHEPNVFGSHNSILIT